jgi:uncharacterized protein (TIGR00369 family)
VNIRTHRQISLALCGTPLHISEGIGKVELTPTEQMAADHYGLVHGGFIFGLADYAAMIAVNDPNVALGAAEVKFLKPVRVGEPIIAAAQVVSTDGKKRTVQVEVFRGEEKVFDGRFTCIVPAKHVLE